MTWGQPHQAKSTEASTDSHRVNAAPELKRANRTQWSLNSGARGLVVPQGKLVCVCGVVGSGKSSLIAGLLGEMKISLKKTLMLN